MYSQLNGTHKKRTTADEKTGQSCSTCTTYGAERSLYVHVFVQLEDEREFAVEVFLERAHLLLRHLTVAAQQEKKPIHTITVNKALIIALHWLALRE